MKALHLTGPIPAGSLDTTLHARNTADGWITTPAPAVDPWLDERHPKTISADLITDQPRVGTLSDTSVVVIGPSW
jgi:hypothetical protein